MPLTKLADTIEKSLYAKQARAEKIAKQFIASNHPKRVKLPNYERKKVVVEDRVKEATVKAEKFSEWLNNMRRN